MTRTLIIMLTAAYCFVPAAYCFLLPGHAAAQTRVAVRDFDGPHARRVRAAVIRALRRRQGVSVVPPRVIASSAKALELDPESLDGRRALARKHQLSAWLDGQVEERDDSVSLTLKVRTASEGALMGSVLMREANLRDLRQTIRTRLWNESQSKIRRAASGSRRKPQGPSEVPAAGAKGDDPDTSLVTSSLVIEELPAIGTPAAPAPAPTANTGGGVPEPRDDPAPAPELSPEPTSPRHRGPAVRASIGVGSPYRSLSFNDPISASLGNHELTGTPMLELDAIGYPFATLTDGWPSWIGVEGGGRLAPSASTQSPVGNRYESRYTNFDLGVRGRIPVREHHVSLLLGYAMTRLAISPVTDGAIAPAPDVDYRMIRAGAGGEVAVSSSLSLGLEGAWLVFLSVGEIARWFPRSTAGGLELSAYAHQQITDGFFARIAAAYQRAYFDFHARPGDLNVAGGAIDQYLTLSVGAGVYL